ncbi:TPA: hypothetical protein ACJWJO_000735 [Streptococcus pneumoniae]
MKMKKIKGGTFMMGTNSEEGFVVDEELVPVELSKITPTLTKTGDSQS